MVADPPEDSDSEAEDDDLSDDMEEEGDDDEGGEVEIIDELGEPHRVHHTHHHHHHHHFESGGEEDWQSDGSDGEEEDEEEDERMLGDTNLETIARALGVGHDGDPDGLDEREDGFLEDEGDDDDMEGEDDDADLEEEEAMLGEDYDDEDEGASNPWGLNEGDDAPIVTRAQPRGIGGWFTLSGAPREPPVFGTVSPLMLVDNLTHPQLSDENCEIAPLHGCSVRTWPHW